MLVEVIKSFAGTHNKITYIGIAGKTLDIPEGTDWIKIGYVKPIIKRKEKQGKKNVNI